MCKEKPGQFVKSLDRSLSIIEELVLSDENLGVTELSNRLGIHKSTIHRLLATLSYRGYVEQDEYGRYKEGLKLFEIGGIVLNKLDLRKRIKPYLVQLQQETKETIHLGILDGKEIVYIDKEETTETIRMYSEVGRRIDAYCTSLGKILLAYKNIDINKLYEDETLRKYTQSTITDRQELSSHLAKVRKQGFAVDNEEQEQGIRCIGGPIFDYRGEISAAFSIAGPTTRMTVQRVANLAKKVIEYSRVISSSMGYNYKK